MLGVVLLKKYEFYMAVLTLTNFITEHHQIEILKTFYLWEDW